MCEAKVKKMGSQRGKRWLEEKKSGEGNLERGGKRITLEGDGGSSSSGSLIAHREQDCQNKPSEGELMWKKRGGQNTTEPGDKDGYRKGL